MTAGVAAIPQVIVVIAVVARAVILVGWLRSVCRRVLITDRPGRHRGRPDLVQSIIGLQDACICCPRSKRPDPCHQDHPGGLALKSAREASVEHRDSAFGHILGRNV
jgi:hypothetical protein